MRPLALALCAAGLLAGCGGDSTPTPPRAGVIGAAPTGGQHRAAARPPRARQSFDPVPVLLLCLRQSKVHGARRTDEDVAVGPAAQGLRIRFLATAGVAETAQLQGRAEGAEVLGRALLFPGHASSSVLKRVEDCTATAGLKD